MPNPELNPSPRALSAIALLGALLALAAGGYIGLDLYRGLVDGNFLLVRGKPITPADGFRYWLTAFGEGFGVLCMVFGTWLMLKLYSMSRTLASGTDPASSGSHRE